MSDLIRIGGGLLLVIAANIALGSLNAILEGQYDNIVFIRGMIKGGIVILSLLAVYAAGRLNPDLLVIDAGGEQINLMTGVHLLLVAAYASYGIDVLKKLRDILLQGRGTQ